ncbi:MAG: response regulator [Proteobacteria bacterium]|nr:response regulator [Pseudomonadota bacterium]
MQKIKILLIDDEEDFVKMLSERLRTRNLESDIALNGEQALELVVNQVPDVMILDLKMPGLDGMEVLRHVKTTYPDVEIIILTGHYSLEDRIEALVLGAYEFLEKPVDIDHLINTIKQAYKSLPKSASD